MQPSDYSIPHDKFRPHQGETLLKILSIKPSGVTLLDAPTGSGKSAIPAGVSSRRKVIACTHTKLLQRQYRDIYGFDMMTGKGNHSCVAPDGVAFQLTAEDCLMPKMHMCSRSGECPYLLQKIKARASMHSVTNYAYWLTAGDSWLDQAPPDDIFLDEGHTLPEVVLGFVGTTINARQAQEYGFPSLPDIAWVLPDKARRSLAIYWLEEAKGKIAKLIRFYKDVRHQGDQQRQNGLFS